MKKRMACAAFVLGMLLVAAEDTIGPALEHAARFEHAQDRREAVEALRVRSGLSYDAWATNLLVVATNCNSRFLLQDMSMYSTTNSLGLLRAVFEDVSRERSMRLAAFRVFALTDGFGDQTLSLVRERSVTSKSRDGVNSLDMVRAIRSQLSSNDVRRIRFERVLAGGTEQE